MIEQLIQALPSLSLFDTFMFRACGDYCLKECRYGFPHLVLNEWSNCLGNEARRNLSVSDSSTYVQVYRPISDSVKVDLFQANF